MFYLVSTVCAIGMIIFFWIPFFQVLPDLSAVYGGLVVAAILAVIVVTVVTDDSKM